MFEKILVPLDGSDVAETVLPYVEEIAAKSRSEVVLMTVSDPASSVAEHLYRAHMEEVSLEVEHGLEDRGLAEPKVCTELVAGKPAVEILRYADEKNTSLIAMAGRGATGEKGWSLGNIASKVLQATNKPVLLTKVPAGKAVLQGKRLIRRILLPLDTSPAGEAAVPYAQELARLLGSEVWLIHVLEPVPVPIVVAPGVQVVYPPVSSETEARWASSALDYLEGMGKRLQEKGVSTKSEVSFGYAATEIIKYAEANNIDLIALSTHGRSGIGRWVFGSVTEKLLHIGAKPMLVVREAKK